jgi:hypothetical protein
MKKLSLLFTLALAFTIASQAQIRIGAKIGWNINSVAFNYAESDSEPETKMVLGFHLGGTAEFGLNDQMAIQSGLLYTRKGFRYDVEELHGGVGIEVEGYDRVMISYIEIPIHFAYKFGDFQVYAGPYFAFGIGGKNKWDVTYTGVDLEGSYSDEISFKPFFGEVGEGDLRADEAAYRGLDLGFNLGVGYKMDKFLINAGYSLGLGNITPDYEGDFDAADYKASNRVISLSASYFFLNI